MIQFKNSKTGLGHETEELEKQKERCNLHLESMAKQAKDEVFLNFLFKNIFLINFF